MNPASNRGPQTLVFGNGEIGILIYPREIVLVPNMPRQIPGECHPQEIPREQWAQRVSLAFLFDVGAEVLIDSIQKCLALKGEPTTVTFEVRVLDEDKEASE